MTKSTKSFSLVLVTAPDLKTARMLAKSALKAKLVACVNLVPGIESHYWWKNQTESAVEVLLILKTITTRVAQLQRLILSEHPYEAPEFLVVKIDGGDKRYLKWLSDAVR